MAPKWGWFLEWAGYDYRRINLALENKKWKVYKKGKMSLVEGQRVFEIKADSFADRGRYLPLKDRKSER